MTSAWRRVTRHFTRRCPSTRTLWNCSWWNAADSEGKWRIKLTSPGSAEPAFEKTYEHANSSSRIYADIIPILEAESRGAFVEALQAAGLRGSERAADESREPGAEIEDLLRRVDFVAQYAAVRAAHRALAEQGESPAWLGVLVRGYANLAVLTRHQWCTATEVFAAHAWLYAQRMMVRCEESPWARWHRAYAWTLTGVMHLALDELEPLERLEAPGDEASTETGDRPTQDVPPWARLLKPYARCDRQMLKQIAEQNPELKPWAMQLWFELTAAYRVGLWVHQAAEECAEVIPTAYGVFADMARFGASLGTTRMGAVWGPRNFAQFLPRSVGAIAELPEGVQQTLARQPAADGSFSELSGRREPDRTFSDLPRSLAKELRKAAEQECGPDPSWSMLAFLLEEEQFVQIANYLLVSTNAVEYSLADAVDSVLPLVQSHRFAAYIESYRYSDRDVDELQRVMGSLPLEDPRMNACHMLFRSWNVQNAAGKSIGQTGYAAAYRDFTMPALLENAFFRSDGNQTQYAADFMKELAVEFREIVPHSDIGIRMTLTAVEKPTMEQLREWESQLKEDPTSFLVLGHSYERLGDTDRAVACYEKSYQLVPTFGAARMLGSLYRNKRDYTKWEQALQRFLETESYGLEHAVIRTELAFGYASRGMWRKAQPDAEAAGQTGSLFGMNVASYIAEGLGEWDESEEWIRGAAAGYPGTEGHSWYFWCRRNGRGDVASAEKLAAEFFAVPLRRAGKLLGEPVTAPKRDDVVRLGAYQLLQGDRDRALESYRKALEFYPSLTCAFMIAQLSRDRGENAARAEVLDAVAKAVTEKPTESPQEPQVVAAGLAIIELMKTGDASEPRLAQVDKLLSELDFSARSDFAYFVAQELATLGKTAEAEQYWRRSLVLPGRDPIYATLAGVELAKRHGTSRPDDDELGADDLWPPEPSDQAEGERGRVED